MLMEVRERNSISYNNPPQPNQESSSRLSPAPLIPSSPSNNRRDEASDHLHRHQKHHNHGFRLVPEQQEETQTQRPRRDPNPDPDLVQLVMQATPQLSLPPPLHASGAAAVVVRYRECLRNHAANIGTHVVDGCGEFMPNGEEGTAEALKCAACECHRSFHRREVEGEPQPGHYTQTTAARIPIHSPPPRAATAARIPTAQLAQQQHVHKYHHPLPPIMMAFGGPSGAPAESSSEDLNIFRSNAEGQMVGQPPKKRFRTKFTQEQKDKMHEFAEKIEWKIQKRDEQEVLQFCNEVGLTKQVFKVWMHNNKQAMKKKQLEERQEYDF